MKIVNASYEILDELNEVEILKKIERVARTCYKSESRITDESAKRLVKNLISNDHMAMLEHFSFSVKFIVDRGISHEIVRHRIASFAQESTRYCNYKNELTFIKPCYIDESNFKFWKEAMSIAENLYLNSKLPPEQKRMYLPSSIKTEVVVTTNLREWIHIFNLRAFDKTGKAHPQMKEVMIPLFKELNKKLPNIFLEK